MTKTFLVINGLMMRCSKEAIAAYEEQKASEDAERRAYLQGVYDTLTRLHDALQPLFDSSLNELKVYNEAIEQNTAQIKETQARLEQQAEVQVKRLETYVSNTLEEFSALFDRVMEHPEDMTAKYKLTEFVRMLAGDRGNVTPLQ